MATPTGILNPYAVYLGDRDPVEVMEATSAALASLAAELGSDGLERSLRPGSWSARMILAHLADCEIAFAFRFRQCLAEDHHVIQPFDQDKWNALLPDRPAADSLRAFAALRESNITLVMNVDEATMSKPITHPERGQMTFRTVVETAGGHDLNHLKQLMAIRAAMG
jgi:hypothetical protein